MRLLTVLKPLSPRVSYHPGFSPPEDALPSPFPEGRGEKVTVGYIAGTGFCGSTLVSFVLNTHPQIFSPGEVGPARREERRADTRCSCGALLMQCPFFLEVAARMCRQGLPLDLGRWRLRYRFSDSMSIERLARRLCCEPRLEPVHKALRAVFPPYRRFMSWQDQRNEAFIRAALAASHKRIFLDATKLHTRVSELRRMPTIELRVIHLVRDPRAFCYSAHRRNGKPFPVLARNWVAVNRAIHRQVDALPTRAWVRVNYESLCRDPARGFAALAEFLGAEGFRLPDNFRAFPHHIIGNQMRKASDRRTTVELDEKWKNELPPHDQKVIAGIAGSHARAYGYEI